MGVTQNIKRDNIFISIKRNFLIVNIPVRLCPDSGDMETGLFTKSLQVWLQVGQDVHLMPQRMILPQAFIFLVGLNKLNCILGVNPLYYSYGIADYFFGGFWQILNCVLTRNPIYLRL